MGILRRIAAWGVVLAALGILLLFAMPSYRQGEASIAGKTAQDFPLEITGKPAHLTDLKGKVVAADEDPAAYEKFLHDQGVVFLTFRDASTKDNHSPIAQSYGTSMYPETYVIDRKGKIARKFIGFQQWDSPDMLAYFDALLGQT